MENKREREKEKKKKKKNNYKKRDEEEEEEEEIEKKSNIASDELSTKGSRSTKKKYPSPLLLSPSFLPLLPPPLFVHVFLLPPVVPLFPAVLCVCVCFFLL
eukprot:Rhum_TRINITY_DN14814_c1_g1::Rhum_TRINITY_DN14814_c1_g1_i1::g.121589::m.121589